MESIRSSVRSHLQMDLNRNPLLRSRLPLRNKATRYYAVATIQFYFSYAQYSAIPVGKGRMVPSCYET